MKQHYKTFPEAMRCDRLLVLELYIALEKGMTISNHCLEKLLLSTYILKSLLNVSWGFLDLLRTLNALFHIICLKQVLSRKKYSHTQPCFPPNRWPIWRAEIEELIMHLLDLWGDMIPSTIHSRVWMQNETELGKKVYLTVMRSIWVLKSLGWVPGNIS